MLCIQVPVTEQHITNGEPKDPAACPVSHAIYDRLTDMGYYVESVRVREESIYVRTKERGERFYISPIEVSDFILDFDEEFDGKPFSFKLMV